LSPSRFISRASAFALATLFAAASVRAGADDTAEAALAEAEVSVARANAKQALWSEAARALRDARAACARAERDECLRRSRDALELARLGILQAEGGTGPR